MRGRRQCCLYGHGVGRARRRGFLIAVRPNQRIQMWGIFPKVGIFGDVVGIKFFKWGISLKLWGF